MTRKKEAGQALYLTAAALAVLVGFLGLGIDVGMLRYEKRVQQIAADAAAIAGANNLAFEGSGTSNVGCAAVNAAANPDSSANNRGFVDNSGNWTSCGTSYNTGTNCPGGVGCVTVTVNNPPASGPHSSGANKNDYVEVLVSAVQPTYFMRIFDVFGGSHDTATVVARAVATDYSGASPNSNCLYTLGDPANEIGVDVQGSVTLNAQTCGIVDNGNFNPTGGGGPQLQVNTCSFGVSGGPASGPGASDVYCGGKTLTPDYNVPTAQNPLQSLNSETPCALNYSCTGGPTVSNPTANTTAGTYAPPASACSGQQLPSYAGVCTLGSISINNTVTFAPGIYIIDGSDGNYGFQCNGGANIGGVGVMFFFTGSAAIDCEGNVWIGNTDSTQGTVNPLVAPSSSNCSMCPSQYDGILLWEDPNDTSTGNLSANGNSCTGKKGSSPGPRLGGNSGSVYNGILYFPGDQVWFFGNTGQTSNATTNALVTDSLCMSGNATLNLQGTSGMTTQFPTLSNAILVE